MDIETLTKNLEKAWSRESSQRPKTWTPGNPAWGQSDATAFVVRSLLGGHILRGVVTSQGKSYVNYSNHLEDGGIVDATSQQFFPGSITETHIKRATPRTRSSRRRATLLMSALDSSESRNF